MNIIPTAHRNEKILLERGKMALVISFDPCQKERNTVVSKDGQLADKISQSIRFGKKAAEQFIQLFGQTFFDLRC
jgi:hypothetical protein